MNNSNRERKRLLDSYMENRLTVFFRWSKRNYLEDFIFL